MKQVILVSLLFFYLPVAIGGQIRTVRVNDTKMQSINLKMGKASVLRFTEKPKKVVIGNQNYYSIEFIENDLTIQPLGNVETNLFVYTPYRTYGFILRVCQACRYDDLVYVKWKSKYDFSKQKRRRQRKSNRSDKSNKSKITPSKSASNDMSFGLDEKISVMFVKTIFAPDRALRIIDLQIRNSGFAKINLSHLKIIATRSNIVLPNQGYVVGKDWLKRDEITRSRLFISSKEKKSFTINFILNGRKREMIIDKKYLKGN